MKEKIKNEYAVKNGFDDWDDLLCNALPDFGRFAINEVMDIFVNQEVERRIAEMMDEMEAGFLERWIRTFNLYSDTSAFCNGYRRMREERDRLVSSQKTEGGGE